MSISGFLLTASFLDPIVGSIIDGITGDSRLGSKAELAQLIKNELQTLHDKNMLDISNITNLASRFVPLGKAASIASEAVKKLRENQAKLSSDLADASKKAFDTTKKALEAQPRMGSVTGRLVQGAKDLYNKWDPFRQNKEKKG